MRPDWRPTVALGNSVLMSAAVLVLAVVMRRADLVVIAAPFVVCLAVAVARRRPDTAPSIELRVPVSPVWEGDAPAVSVGVGAAPGVDVVQLGIVHTVGLQATHTEPVFCLVPGENVDVPFTATRWGHKTVGPVASVLVSGGGLFTASGAAAASASFPVVPAPELFSATDAAPVAGGLVGAHRSARPGEGTDLAQTRPYLPGDRLHRVSWPASARTGQLHVTSTLQDLDLEVYLLIDSGVDVAEPSMTSPSSLDITVRAAAAIAERYLRNGDRVGLLDLGSRRRPVPARAGQRQLSRLLAALLDAAPDVLLRRDATRGDPRLRQVPPRALVMVLSALLDEQIGSRLATLTRRGNPILVIDTLPPSAAPPHGTEATTIAWRLAMLRRDTLRARMSDHGIPVVAWEGAGSLDHVLVQLARSARISRRRQ